MDELIAIIVSVLVGIIIIPLAAAYIAIAIVADYMKGKDNEG